MDKKKKNWIAGAVSHPGALTAKANAVGKTVPQYCAQPHGGVTAKQCNLAKTFKEMK